ncbi:MAG TPA: ribonuclease domain-containing protein [Nocardioides sp.]|nr:ribonuclease domain-containing protein [Nocardioides sp.]
MKWNRQTVTTVVIVFATIAFTSFILKFTMDHDGDTITLFGDDPSPSAVGSVATDETSDGVETGDIDPESGLPWVLQDELPVEAQATLALIDQGGPFPYPGKDGSTFGNFEGLLPDHPRGYYAEYTVITPGSSDRGARRIIAGDGGEYYWTEDHYESFARIARAAGTQQ